MKSFVFSIFLLLSFHVIAQDVTITKLPNNIEPIIDGNVDTIWSYADTIFIEIEFVGENPTISNAFWQALWNDEALFIKLEVEDDYHCDVYCSGDASYTSDKVELYFDVNELLNDGLGPTNNYSGHYQLAPEWIEGEDQGVFDDYQSKGIEYSAAYKITESGYTYEYKIDADCFENADGNSVYPFFMDSIGFDVYVVDRDSANDSRRRLVWKNDGVINENWLNMDNAGTINFSCESAYMGIIYDYSIFSDNQPFQLEVLKDSTKTVIFDIKNIGNQDLIISSLEITNDAFTLHPLADSTLSQGEKQQLIIDYIGQSVGLHQGILKIISTSSLNDTFNIKLQLSCYDQYFTEFLDFASDGTSSGTLEWFDFDNDGDLDILNGGYYRTIVYKNDLPDSLGFSSLDSLGLGRIESAAIGDYDKDGDLDILVAENTALYKNDLPDSTWFTKQSIVDLPEIYGGSCKWADFNRDGLLDFVICGNLNGDNYTWLYWNENGNFQKSDIFIRGGSDIVVSDYNKDNYPDIIVTGSDLSSSKRTSVFKNDFKNSGEFIEQRDMSLPRVYRSSVDMGDYNNDGNVDLLVTGFGNYYGQISEVYRNENNVFIMDSTIQLFGIWEGTSDWADFDNDGDIDIIIAGDDYNGNRYTKFYNNVLPDSVGYIERKDIEFPGIMYSQCNSGDFDNDGDLDLLLDGWTGSQPVSKLYLNHALTKNILPQPPSELQAIVQENKVIFSWGYGSDNETDSSTLTYNIKVASADGNFVLNSTANSQAGNLKYPDFGNACFNQSFVLNDLDTGTYYWKVQSIDQAFQGSEFSSVDTFVILEPFTENSDAYLSNAIRSKALWGDYNNDDYLDMILTGIHDRRSTNTFLNNKDQTFTEQDIEEIDLGWGGISWTDFDNDGDLDFLVNGKDSNEVDFTKLFRNNLPDSSGFSEYKGLDLTGFHSGSSAWGDYDNDGDLDFIISGWNNNEGLKTKVYRNNDYGLNGFTEQTDIEIQPLWYSSFAWGDYDQDNDLDLIIIGKRTTFDYITKLYKNNGNGNFEEQKDITLAGASTGSALWGDYDSDGDLDILIAGIDGNIDPVFEIYRNDGNNTFTNIYAELRKAINCSADWGDYNNDGYMDLVFSGFSGKPMTVVYKNNMDDTYTEIETDLVAVDWCSANWGDYNKDGSLDILISGNYDARMYRNNTNELNSKPTAPTNLQHKLSGFDVEFNWDKSYDPDNPEGNVYYNLRVGTSPDKQDIFSAMSNIETGFRKIPGMGNVQCNTSWTIKNMESGKKYYWAVQAIDQSFLAGSWSEVDSFLLNQVSPDFTFDTICFQEPTSFTDLSVTSDTIIKWQWDFGDGNFSSEQSPVHLFESAGTFDVALKAFTESGDSASIIKQVLVKSKPVADFIANPVCLGTSTVFSNNSNVENLAIASWNWDLGDETYSSDSVPANHSYSVGSYNVELIVLADNNCSDTVSKQVNVAAYPSASISLTGNTKFCEGDSAILSVAYNDSFNYNWKLNNVSISGANRDSLIVKENSGNYSVQIINSIANCISNSDSIPIIINEIPISPLIEFTGNTIFCSEDSLILSVINNLGYEYYWKRNGGAVGSDTNMYVVNTTGTYSLEVKNSNGCFVNSSNTVNVTVNDRPDKPVISLSRSPEFCEGDSLVMTIDEQSGVSYHWINGSTEIPNESTRKYVAYESGNYYVDVINTTTACSNRSDTTEVSVTEMPVKPTVSTTNYNINDCPQEKIITLSINETSNNYTYQWMKNGLLIEGATESDLSDYLEEGNYSLLVSNQGCESESDNVAIVYNPELPDRPSIEVKGPAVWYLVCTNDEALQYEWYYENGKVSGADEYIYVPGENMGTYFVRIAEENGCFVSSDAVTIPITGVNEMDPFANLKIYPNPTPGMFTIEMDNEIYGELLTRIFAQNAVEIFNIKYDKATRHFKAQIDLSGQGKGIYIISLLLDNYKAERKLIVE